jgi:Zn-dependent protease with chaperone function
MNFFERQDKARRNTKWLVFYFVLAVLCIIATVYLVALLIFGGASLENAPRGAPPAFTLWNPAIFSWAALGTLAVVATGSLVRLSQLSAGGRAVAESLGGRLIPPNTTDPDERRLRNVVEEMALASGVPVPQIYVMDQEDGINAFAAGHTPSDAAIGVTRGCMQLLKRDELQGVIGHEFSHILNGDMRLNLRLMGIIFGILCLTIIGRILLRTRGRNNPLPLLGLVLVLLGWVGVFFGRLIQAAVSRQREFLADASAVQFTRNPQSLSSALQKIGGLVHGSTLHTERAAEASHMFFGNAVGKSFLGAFATHPPLAQRIRAIDPSWDGQFQRVQIPASTKTAEPAQRPSATRLPPIIPLPQRMAAAMAAGFAPESVRAQSILPSLGNPTPLHLRYAEELRQAFPESVQTAAREPAGATALIYALLLSDDPALRERQLAHLATEQGDPVREQTTVLYSAAAHVATRARLPLADLALPALRQLNRDEFARFNQTLEWLVASDQQVDLFEYVLQRVVRRHLEPHFRSARRPVVQYYSLRPLAPDCGVLLSALAHVGSTNTEEIQRAFAQGLPYLRAAGETIWLLPREQCGLAQIDQALNRLALATPQIKKNLLAACIQVSGADGVLQEREAELLRVIADSLDCPLPPFVMQK